MLIVDAQVHIWGANTPQRPWPADAHKAHRDIPMTTDELLPAMDAAGVDRVVLVPPSWEGSRNDLVFEAIGKYPHRLAAMGRVDIHAPDAKQSIADWQQHKGMLGFRFTFSNRSLQSLLAEHRIEWLWTALENAGAPVMLFVNPALLDAVDQVAERHPGLKIILDHLALPGGKVDDEAFAQFDKLLNLAKRPNVAVKASGLQKRTRSAYPYRAIHRYIEAAFDAYGPQRLFWGTDLSGLPCPYRQAVTLFTEELPWLTAEDKEWVMGRGICEWLNWK